MLPYSWNILILVKDHHYKDINDKIQILAGQCRIPIIGRMRKEEAFYHFEPVYIKIELCPTSESIHNLRGCKADTIFTEVEWLAEEEVRWAFVSMCRNAIYSIDTLEQILNGELKSMYNYREEMIKDIKNYIIENNWVEKNYHTGDDYSEMLDRLYDELWDKDEITGNGLNYYDNENKCAGYVISNIPLYLEAIKEFGIPATSFSNNNDHKAQHMDATIRCYLLRDCLEEACEEL